MSWRSAVVIPDGMTCETHNKMLDLGEKAAVEFLEKVAEIKETVLLDNGLLELNDQGETDVFLDAFDVRVRETL